MSLALGPIVNGLSETTRIQTTTHPAQMVCGKNEYIPEGEDKPVYQVVDELASDNELFAEHFLDGWHIMTTHGYAVAELNDGPQNSWMGYERLAAQGVAIDDYEKYISENKPVDFVDPKVAINAR